MCGKVVEAPRVVARAECCEESFRKGVEAEG